MAVFAVATAWQIAVAIAGYSLQIAVAMAVFAVATAWQTAVAMAGYSVQIAVAMAVLAVVTASNTGMHTRFGFGPPYSYKATRATLCLL
jgi:hypothetical protein